MKKLLSILLAALLLAIPALGMAESAGAGETLFEQLMAAYDLSILSDAGLLTEDEVRMLMLEKEMIESGRAVEAEISWAATGLTGDPAADVAISELLQALSVTARLQKNGAGATVTLSGQDVLTVDVGAQGDALLLASNLLDGAVSVTAEDVENLPLRLVNAAQSAGLIDDSDAYSYGMMASVLPSRIGSYAVSAALADIKPEDLDLTAWEAVYAPIEARAVRVASAMPSDCDPSVESWSVEITAQEMNDFVIAAMQVIRDNPVLLDSLFHSMGGGLRMMTMADAQSNEQVMDLMIRAARESALFGSETLYLTGWNDADGALVRLEATVTGVYEVGDGPAEPEVALKILHTRQTQNGETSWITHLGGDLKEGIRFILRRGEGSFYAAMQALEDGEASFSLALEAYWQVERDENSTLLFGEAELTTANRYSGTLETQTLLSAKAGIGISQTAVSIGAYVTVHEAFMETEEAGAAYHADFYLDEENCLAGMEQFSAYTGERKVRAVAMISTQDADGPFTGEVTALGGMTDEELNAWVAALADRVDTWTQDATALLPQSIRDALESHGE